MQHVIGTCNITSCRCACTWQVVFAEHCPVPLRMLLQVDISGNAQHCNGCGQSCLSLPRVENATCVGGQCKITKCKSSWADCDGNARNGCEVRTLWRLRAATLSVFRVVFICAHGVTWRYINSCLRREVLPARLDLSKFSIVCVPNTVTT